MSKYKLIATRDINDSFCEEILLEEVILQDAKLAMYDYAYNACVGWKNATYVFALWAAGTNDDWKPANGAPMFSYTVQDGAATLNEKRFTLECSRD